MKKQLKLIDTICPLLNIDIFLLKQILRIDEFSLAVKDILLTFLCYRQAKLRSTGILEKNDILFLISSINEGSLLIPVGIVSLIIHGSTPFSALPYDLHSFLGKELFPPC